MTCDIRNWIFSIQRIPNFHCIDATNLVESATFRQGCCRPSSRHRSCFALWTFEITVYPSGNFPSTVTISQGTAEFSNCWMPQIDVGSQQLSLLCGRWNFLIHFGFHRLVCAIKFFSQIWFSVRGGYEGFPRCHELLISCVVQPVQTALRG